MEAPILRMRHVSVSYEDERVVGDFSMEVYPGEIVGIAGESGSGKSTVIKAAIGLLGEEGFVDRGDVWFQGRKITDLPQEELRCIRGDQVGMVFQNTGASLCPIRTIGDQFQEMLIQHGKKDVGENHAQILKLLEGLSLPDGERILRSYPFELSGGMNQRVGIALAMVLRPKLLLADEPTSALDVTVQAQVMREFLGLRERYGTSIVIVAHNMGLLYHMTDRLLVMRDGRVVESVTDEGTFGEPQEPYTRRLIQAVPRLRGRQI
ncbi:MAG: ABC transporter ATP-binding protein [Blautia sp.]